MNRNPLHKVNGRMLRRQFGGQKSTGPRVFARGDSVLSSRTCCQLVIPDLLSACHTVRDPGSMRSSTSSRTRSGVHTFFNVIPGLTRDPCDSLDTIYEKTHRSGFGLTAHWGARCPFAFHLTLLAASPREGQHAHQAGQKDHGPFRQGGDRRRDCGCNCR